jgi:hypothetical protein
VTAQKCGACGMASGRVNKVVVAYPNGDVRGGWLHEECEPLQLARLYADGVGGGPKREDAA